MGTKKKEANVGEKRTRKAGVGKRKRRGRKRGRTGSEADMGAGREGEFSKSTSEMR